MSWFMGTVCIVCRTHSFYSDGDDDEEDYDEDDDKMDKISSRLHC